MRVIVAPASARIPRWSAANLAAIVDSLGTQQFLSVLLAALNGDGDFPFACAGSRDATEYRFEPCVGYRRPSFESPVTPRLRRLDRGDPMAGLGSRRELAQSGTTLIAQAHAEEITNPLRREHIFERHRLAMRINMTTRNARGGRDFICVYRADELARKHERRLIEIAPLALSLLHKHWQIKDASSVPAANADAEGMLRERKSLSEREIEVCCALLRGRTLPQIAQRLNISATTARTYQLRAFARLGVRTRQHLFEMIFPD